MERQRLYFASGIKCHGSVYRQVPPALLDSYQAEICRVTSGFRGVAEVPELVASS